MNNWNKGQIRVIEAFLAVLIIFSSFAVSANLTVTRNVTKNYELTSIGLQTLLKLDSEGKLGEYIDKQNWTALREGLNLALPASTIFNLTVYDEQMHQINTEIISNGAFSSQNIASVEYICVSQNSVLHCYKLYLQLAVAE